MSRSSSHHKNPLVASGAFVTGFSTAVAAPGTGATVSAAGVEVPLTRRGAKVVADLLTVVDSSEDVRYLEQALKSLKQKGSELISPADAAALLGVSRPTVVRWADEGLLADFKVNSRHKFARAEVIKLRDKRQAEAATNRAHAQALRNKLEDQGVDLDVPPTPAEMAAAGAALRRGDRAGYEAVFARSERASAREAAQRAGVGHPE